MTKEECRRFVKDETERVLSEMDAIERSKPQSVNVAACPNNADESTLEAFEKAVEASIDLFAERTKHLR